MNNKIVKPIKINMNSFVEINVSTVISIVFKVLCPNLQGIYLIGVFFVVFFITKVVLYLIKQKKILNSYKALNDTKNWDDAFAEKLILKLFVQKGIKTFLQNDELGVIVNKAYSDVEEYDIEPEDLATINRALQQFNNKEQLDEILKKLIAREFVKPINNKGLLEINSNIYNYIFSEKQILEKKEIKEKKEYERKVAKIKKRQLNKSKPTITRKIKNIFIEKFRFPIKISNLEHTWILDVDGTIVKHNGYKLCGKDSLLEGVKDFFDNLPIGDKVVLLTARKEEALEDLKNFLKENNLHYDYLLTDLPMGERILVNDRKPSGLDMAFAINKNRDEKLKIKYRIDEDL